MNEVRHTPGLWVIHRSGTHGVDVISQSAGRRVADCNPELGRDERDEDEAVKNARLIATAPELLAALKSIILYVETYGGMVTKNFDGQSGNIAYYKGLIAKAEQGDK